MEKPTAYREIIKDAIRAQAQPLGHGEIEVATLFDDESGHYQLLYLGWEQKKRTFAVILHVRLHNGKVWVERAGPADGIANTLLEAGIPRDEIVLAFHSPWKRQFTEFAVA